MVECHWQDRALVVRLRGELDIGGAQELRAVVDPAWENGEALAMIFDLSGLTFIDSSGLGAILGRYRRVAESGGRTMLVGLPEGMRRQLEMAGLLRLLPLFESCEAALAEGMWK